MDKEQVDAYVSAKAVLAERAYQKYRSTRTASDEEVLQRMNHYYACARSMPKEGAGCSVPHGTAGRVSEHWLMWRREARERGLV